jgi:hypothetical protein
MKSQEEMLNWRNKIAGTLGTPEVQAVLQEFLTAERAKLIAWTPSDKDPNAYCMHRYVGRIEMLEFLINQGKSVTEKESK